MINQIKPLQAIKLFVLDMDGTVYLDEQLLDGAPSFLEALERVGKSRLFFTNNSSKTAAFYRARLERMGCVVPQEAILTSGDVTIAYLKKHHPGKSVFLLGTPLLAESFRKAGISLEEDSAEIAVAAFDTTLAYDRLARFCTLVRNGAVFLATHPDINCPTQQGFLPDCGALCALITASTGKTPRFLGKPAPETLEMIVAQTGFQPKEIAFVGDRLYTDVAAGIQNGAAGILVLTGEATQADADASPLRPTLILPSLKELAELL